MTSDTEPGGAAASPARRDDDGVDDHAEEERRRPAPRIRRAETGRKARGRVLGDGRGHEMRS